MSLWCAWYYKHATLIRNVYPQNPGEEGPRASALSLLLFYATSKPQKLSKIGRFLENKVQTDLRSHKYGHVRVSLDIINMLLHECRQKTAIISRNILRILLAIYQSYEKDLFIVATETFILFIGIRSREEVADLELNTLLLQLLDIYCKAATQNIDHRQRIAGMRALEILSAKNYFIQGTITIEKLEKVLETVIQSYQPVIKSPVTTEPKMEEQGSIVDILITAEDLMLLSTQCIHGIFRNTNGTTLKQLFEISLKIIETKGGLENSSLFDLVLKAILVASPSQYHFAIATSLWKKLESETREKESTTLVCGLKSLMTIRSLAGMTVVELLDYSLKHLEKIIEGGCTAESTTRSALVDAIGSLSIHTAYPNQIRDILSLLAARAEQWHATQNSTNPLLLISVFEAMAVVINHKSLPDQRRSSIQATMIPHELILPLIKFFQIQNVTIRVRLAEVLRIYLHSGMEHRHTPARTEFLDTLRSAMYTLVKSKWVCLSDYVIANILLCNIVALQSYTELAHSLPMLFHLQTKVIDSATLYTCQKISMYWNFVEYLLYVAEFLSISELSEYAKGRAAELKQLPWQPPFQMEQFRFEKLIEEPFNDDVKSLAKLEMMPTVEVEKVMSSIRAATFEDCDEIVTKVEHALTQPFLTQIAPSRDEIVPKIDFANSEESKLEDSYRDIKKMMKVDESSLKPPLQPKDIPVVSPAPEEFEPFINSESDGLPEVVEILKTLNEALLKDKVAKELNKSVVAASSLTEDYELDWLKSRSRQVSNQTGVVLSQKKPIVAEVRHAPGRRREPQIFELNSEED